MKKQIEFGGMAKCIDCNGTKLEKHYRHIFKSDEYVIELLKEFNLLDKLSWRKTKMGYYSEKGLYEFGTPISLLKYKPLTFIEKIRFGMSVIKLKTIREYKSMEDYSAEEWMKNNCGEKVYQKIWEPLLISKFGDKKNIISMVWLWGKINLRSSSSAKDGERLGYLDGSFEKLTEKLEDYLLNKNCRINTNQNVIEIYRKENKYVVKTNKGEQEYDVVLSTVSYNAFSVLGSSLLTERERKQMEDLKYTSAKTLLMYSKKTFTPFYWINIGKKEIPFGGIIEHTNMVEPSAYNDTHIIYISNYMDKNDRLYKLNAKDLFKEYIHYLKIINPEFKEEDITELQCFEEEDAQPIITTNYSHKILNMQLEEKGIFIANMAQIYPEDRGMNYAIKLGYEVANEIMKYNGRR